VEDKPGAYQFLTALQNDLNERLPRPATLRQKVDAIWKKPKKEKTERELLGKSIENIAFYHFALPHIFDLAISIAKLTPDDATKAFRCEYHGKFPDFSSSNVFRKGCGHPFAKKWGMKPEEIYDSWRKEPTSSWPLNQSYPELSLSAPFPWKILFEVKYFKDENIRSAEKALVEGVYEAVFYRGIPPSNGWGPILDAC
jgi:hypothetical protein